MIPTSSRARHVGISRVSAGPPDPPRAAAWALSRWKRWNLPRSGVPACSVRLEKESPGNSPPWSARLSKARVRRIVGHHPPGRECLLRPFPRLRLPNFRWRLGTRHQALIHRTIDRSSGRRHWTLGRRTAQPPGRPGSVPWIYHPLHVPLRIFRRHGRLFYLLSLTLNPGPGGSPGVSPTAPPTRHRIPPSGHRRGFPRRVRCADSPGAPDAPPTSPNPSPSVMTCVPRITDPPFRRQRPPPVGWPPATWMQRPCQIRRTRPAPCPKPDSGASFPRRT